MRLAVTDLLLVIELAQTRADLSAGERDAVDRVAEFAGECERYRQEKPG